LTASQNDHSWGIEKLKAAGTKIQVIDPAAKKAWAQKLAPWVNSRAQAVSKKKNINMGEIMRAYIAGTKAGGHVYPVDYVIN
jgi:hypothetical protein